VSPGPLDNSLLPGLEPAVVEEWIHGLDIGAQGPLTFARTGNGMSNLTYLVSDAAGSRWVLRRPPIGPLLPSAHDVAREHRILSALQQTSVPTPAVCGFTTDSAVTDAPLMLMSFVDGVVVDGMTVAEELTPEVRGRLGRALPPALARIHEVDLAATGLDSLASHEPYAARQIRRWRRQWEGSQTRDLPAIDELGDRLSAAIPEQREVTLVHGDYHLVNVIAAPDGSEVRAVLDWELCTLGDPLADVGALMAYWPRPGDAGTGPFVSSRLAGFPEREELAAIYADETHRDLSALPFWYVLGLWKIAVIGEGVRKRALDRGGVVGTGVLATDFVPGLLAQAQYVADTEGL
jgi:aminoglycoside phosphotransferase (APT) family kinase protein